MSEVLHGNASGDQLNASKDKTQVYGLSGNDTLISDRKSDALLVGGSGDDSLIMLGGNGTLSGGDGSDIFELNYSTDNPISAVIEDLDPTKDKIVVNFDGNTAPKLSSVTSGNDVIWTNGGNFNLTLKSARENDYFDGEASDEAWDVLKLTNDEREKENLTWLTMADGLTEGAQIRAQEITGLAERGALSSHERPDNKGGYSSIFDDVDKHYSYFGENLQAGAESSAEVMKDWIDSPDHKKNILDEKFNKLGVGYNYKDLSKNEYYWTQLFADSLNNPETVSAENLSGVRPEGHTVRKFIQLTKRGDIYNNNEYGATIAALGGNDKITNTGLIASISGGKDDDIIDNSGSFVTINAGTGNDEINLSQGAKYNLIEYNIGDGSDNVSGLHSTDTLSISGYEYTPVTVGNNVIIAVGTNSITLADAASLSSINVEGTRSKIFMGTEGNDKLNNTVGGATIQALGGDDKITISGENVLFVHESGDDTVRGFNDTSTLKVLGENYSSITSGNDFILTNADKKSSITILNAASLNAINIVDANDRPLEVERVKNIVGTDDPDNLRNGSDDVTIQALGGDDTVTNKGDGVLIDGGADNDSISNDGSDVTIIGGGGSDTIKNTGDNNSILGGADDDTIEISGDENTINAEGGDDYISVKGSRNVIEYVAGSGKDVIEGFNQTSTLRISGDVYTSTTSNKDIVVTVGEQTISLVGAADLNKINIVGTSQTETTSSNYMDYNGHRYQLFDEGMTWEEAKAYCESLGGHLVVITDAAEQAAIEGLLKEKGTKNSYWMGGFKGNDGKLITLTEGDDTYSNFTEGVTIQALGGNDSIDNWRDSASIIGGTGSDTVSNGGDSVTISGDVANDFILNGYYFDSKNNDYGRNVIVDGGAGNDTLQNNGASSTINGGEGDDSIHNSAISSTLEGGDGDDYIYNYGDGSSISGGDGSDTISSAVYGTLSSGLWNTINAGLGDDYISLSGGNNQIFYNAGDGSDTIEGVTSTDTINISGTTYTRSTISNDVVLTVGDDSIRLVDAASLSLNIDGEEDTTSGSAVGVSINNDTSNTLITGTSGNDSITNSGEDVTILALGGDDTISGKMIIEGTATVFGNRRVSIDGGSGNDSINNGSTSYSTLNGGAGDDTLSGRYATDSALLGGDGNDSIYSYSDNLINPGRGDDTIELWQSDTGGYVRHHNIIQYTSGDGNDLILNYFGDGDSWDDTIQIYGGSEYSTTTSGNDIIVEVGEGSITLRNAINEQLNIQTIESSDFKFVTLSENADNYRNITEGATIQALGGDDTIENFGGKNSSINGGDGDDNIENNATGTKINGGDGIDDIDNSGASVTIDAGAGNDDIWNFDDGKYASINLEDGDDEAVNNGDYSTVLGGSGNDFITLNGGTNYVIINGEVGNDYIDAWGSYSTINGGTGDDTISLSSYASVNLIQYTSGDGNDTIYGFNDTSTLSISGAEYSTTTSGNDVIVTVGDGSISLVGAASLNSVNITSGVASGVTIDNSTSNTLVTGSAGDDSITNSGEEVTIQALGGNDTITNRGESVSIEGGEGDDSINHIAGQYVTINSGAGNDNIDNSGSSQYNDYITINSGTGNDSISNGGHNVTINTGDGNDTVENHRDWVVINGDEGADYITSRTGIMAESHVTINGGADNDTIINSNTYSDNSISGGAGDDSILNAGANSTLDGGTGNDIISLSSDAINNLIQYASGEGDDTITGFNDTSTLSIAGAAYSTTTSGNDVIVTVDDGSITLKDAASLSAINLVVTLNSSGSWQWVTGETWDYTNWNDNEPDGSGNYLQMYDVIAEQHNTEKGKWDDTANDLSTAGYSTTEQGLICEWETIPSSKLIELTEGPDTYSESMESDTTLKALGGNDYINNWKGDSVTIDLGADDDYILNHSSYVLIEGADGSDTVASWIVDDDTLGTSSAYNTIRGGAGDDSIDNHGHHALIEGNDGNDTLYNYVGDDGGIHQGYEANYSTVRGGRGNDEIDNHGNHVLIEGGTGNDTIYNNNGAWFDDEAEYSTIYGGAGHDSIINHGASSIIDGANGNDSIHNYSSAVSIGGGADHDYIYNEGSQVSINGNAGDDSIDNHGKNDTILGGSGNDEISLSTASKNNFIRYADGDGNDTVWGATPDDTINILGVESYSSVKSGKNDLLIKVGNGSILLKDARNRPPKITLGESGSSGGTGGGGSGSSGGNSGGGSGGSNSSGGTSSNSNSNSAASGGNSASGSSGTSSGLSGSSGRGSRLSTRQISATTSPPVQTPRNQIISNYQSGSKINSSEGHTGAFFDGAGNFYSGSTTGAIVIPDATNKLIDLRDAAGNPFIKAYRASNAGVIDGRSFAGFEIINGSAGSDEIYAGVNGSQMTGGTGNDTLTGGRGIDIFVSGKSQGNDLIRNASLLDKISLTDVTLNDITSTRENDKTVSLTFRAGSIITVESKDILSPSFVLSDGSYFFYNSISKSWRVMNQASENQKVYGGGEQTISSYQSGEKILFNAEYRGGSYDGEGNFKVNSSAGSLVVQNAMDKVIDLTNSAGNSIIKAYAASTSGVINGKDLTGYQIINGSAGADVICAGNGGSQLWGGAEADVLIGGDGADTFITGRTHGADLISNASTADNINLNDATLSDIVGTSESNGTISLSFNTGNVINVQSSEALSARFTLADGSAYRYNHARKTWQSA